MKAVRLLQALLEGGILFHLLLAGQVPLRAAPVDAAPQPVSGTDGHPLGVRPELLDLVEDPLARARILLDLLEACDPDPCPEEVSGLIDEALILLRRVDDPAARVPDLLRIARWQHRFGPRDRALATLEEAERAALGVPGEAEQAALLLRVGLARRQSGDTLSGQALMDRGEALLSAQQTPRVEPSPTFPFEEQPANKKLGFGFNVASLKETTAYGQLSANLYKQWARHDINFDGFAGLDYDDSRTVGTFQPTAEVTLIFRHHLNSKWNLFFDQLSAVNSQAFQVDDDDGDLSVISSSLVGAGYNLWRGEGLGRFLDLQAGLGGRYEYEYVDFEQRINEISPAVYLGLVGREVPLGSARLSQILGVVTLLDDFGNTFALSDTRLDLPLAKRWSWTSRLILRLRAAPLVPENPPLNVLFSTGFTYSFSPQ